MPVYEYRCRACGRVHEEIRPMGSVAPGSCPVCGGKLRRIWGRVGVRFSGWGFSATDRLAPEGRPRKDFRALRDKAEEITDSD